LFWRASFFLLFCPGDSPLRWQNPKLKGAWQRGTLAHRSSPICFDFCFVCQRRLLLPPSQDPEKNIIPRTTKHPTIPPHSSAADTSLHPVTPPCQPNRTPRSPAKRPDTTCNPSQKYPSTVLYMTMPNTLSPHHHPASLTPAYRSTHRRGGGTVHWVKVVVMSLSAPAAVTNQPSHY
jgi:hypothetical protein